MLKYRYIFQTKIYRSNFIKQHTETVIFEITKMLIAVLKNKYIVLLIIIFHHTFFPNRCGLSLHMPPIQWSKFLSLCVLGTLVSPTKTAQLMTVAHQSEGHRSEEIRWGGLKMRDLVLKYNGILGLICNKNSTNRCTDFNQFTAQQKRHVNFPAFAMAGW